MRLNRIRWLGLILGSLALISVFPFATAAQNTASQATPGSHESPRFALMAKGDYPNGYFDDVVASPGESVELTVTAVNTGEIPVELRLFKVNALNAPNGGYASGKEDDEPVAPTTWLEFPTMTVTLEPGTQQDVPFRVHVPQDATPGQHIAGIVARTADAMDISGTDSLDYTLGYAISVGILVPGEIVHEYSLGEPEFTEESGIRRLQVPVTNTGNYLVRPTGTLVLTDSSGREVLKSDFTMGSVYAGLSTTIEITLPNQMVAGEYTVALTLKDEASGASASLDNTQITLPEPKDPFGLNVETATVEPNADPIVFANVAVTLDNGGQQIPAANVTLNVLRDGEEVESFPLATNQVLPNGETEISARYLPADVWESGTYTFEVVVSAVDPQGGTETILATIEVEDEIVVP